MFVSVARVTLEIPESGSLKAKRQVVRRVVDRVKDHRLPIERKAEA